MSEHLSPGARQCIEHGIKRLESGGPSDQQSARYVRAMVEMLDAMPPAQTPDADSPDEATGMTPREAAQFVSSMLDADNGAVAEMLASEWTSAQTVCYLIGRGAAADPMWPRAVGTLRNWHARRSASLQARLKTAMSMLDEAGEALDLEGVGDEFRERVQAFKRGLT